MKTISRLDLSGLNVASRHTALKLDLNSVRAFFLPETCAAQISSESCSCPAASLRRSNKIQDESGDQAPWFDTQWPCSSRVTWRSPEPTSLCVRPMTCLPIVEERGGTRERRRRGSEARVAVAVRHERTPTRTWTPSSVFLTTCSQESATRVHRPTAPRFGNSGRTRHLSFISLRSREVASLTAEARLRDAPAPPQVYRARVRLLHGG